MGVWKWVARNWRYFPAMLSPFEPTHVRMSMEQAELKEHNDDD
jgi:hypothetical protein